jgi:hypothetical protein
MESNFQAGWIKVDTGKGSGWLAGRSFCCQNVGHVLAENFQIFDMTSGMLSVRQFLLSCSVPYN